MSKHVSCESCRHYLGGGQCRINLEAECREGGGFEAREISEEFMSIGHQSVSTGKYETRRYNLSLNAPEDDKGASEDVRRVFRGKSSSCFKWVEGDLIHLPRGVAILSKGYDYVKPETVGQYTGLKDRNGVRIFEGDVVVNKHPRRLSNRPFVVKYGYISGGYGYLKLDIHDQLEVIGNIHDTPELVGGDGHG